MNFVMQSENSQYVFDLFLNRLCESEFPLIISSQTEVGVA